MCVCSFKKIYKWVSMSQLYTRQTWAHLGGPWGMADHFLRRLVFPDSVLLLVEEGEARHEVTGHQVCVLDREPHGLS